MRSRTGWVLWAGTLGFTTPVLERLDAARSVDVQRFSITPLDVEWAAANGITAKDLGTRIRAAGYEILMDPVVGWYGGIPHPRSTFARFSTDDTLRMGEEVGVVAFNLIGQPTHDASLGQLVAAFADVCDRVEQFGTQAMLEFTPITAIKDLAAGWDIVRGADRANGGLLFDTWHFYKGNPDFDLLATIPGDKVFSVQIADARAVTLADVRQDTVQRALPGQGVLDLPRVVRALDAIDALRWVGPEVISPELAAQGPVLSATRADSATRAVVDAVCATADTHDLDPHRPGAPFI